MSETSTSEPEDTPERRARIAALNDAFRRHPMGSGGVLASSLQVQDLDPDTFSALLKAVMTFTTFTPDNDPHGEHDFGRVEVGGGSYYWKIDYYDRDLKYGSEDPADPSKTKRVLTLMHVSEY